MRTAALLAMVVGLCCDVAVAQEQPVPIHPVDPEPENFKESFDESRAVSGSALVGLRLGDAQGQVVPDDIVLLRPSGGGTICVHAMTQDGRFSASNPYVVPEDASPGRYLQLEPITREHRVRLASYPADQFAVRAFVPVGEGCSPAGATHVPAVATGGDLKVLYVFVNSKTQSVRASLGQEAPVDCEPAGTSAFIAYDQKCRITFEAKGTAVLDLELDDGFGSEHYQYSVVLPAGP
ncbi:hypothetical protein [Devosia nitrariae]|uniref:Secreted protein n=1 Tax=Devosia nitrariae TaxID=2071872 RepID=A0ABQ5W1U4_9HYPH|nr:hypothetical protein [Devosia nitrariae]GLQ53808.1 hypothetical protein GCM10010862_10670 [Devosia nitrariae]